MSTRVAIACFAVLALACAAQPVTPKVAPVRAPAPAVAVPKAPAEPAIEVGMRAHVTRPTEGRWIPDPGQDRSLSAGIEGLVTLEAGASRPVVAREGGFTLLEIYPKDPEGPRDVGLAWLPNEVLSAQAPVTLPPSPPGQAAYLRGARLSHPALRVGSGPITRCGIHYVLSRADKNNHPISELGQLEDGVWLHGWVGRDVPLAEPVRCEAGQAHKLFSEAMGEAERKEFFVVNEIELAEQVLKAMRAEPLLFVMAASQSGVVCEAHQVRKTGPRAFRIEHPWITDDEGFQVQMFEAFDLKRGDETFHIDQSGIIKAKNRGIGHARCGEQARFLQLDDDVLMMTMAYGDHGAARPEVVLRNHARGWFRNRAACEHAAAWFNDQVRTPEKRSERSEVAVTIMSGGGC